MKSRDSCCVRLIHLVTEMATDDGKHGLRYVSGGWRRTSGTGFRAQSSSKSLWGRKLQKPARLPLKRGQPLTDFLFLMCLSREKPNAAIWDQYLARTVQKPCLSMVCPQINHIDPKPFWTCFKPTCS